MGGGSDGIGRSGPSAERALFPLATTQRRTRSVPKVRAGGTSVLHVSTGPDSACTNPGTTEPYQSFRLGDWERHIDLQAPVFMRPNAEQPLDQLHGSIRKFSADRLMFDKKRLMLAQLFLRRGELPLLFPK